MRYILCSAPMCVYVEGEGREGAVGCGPAKIALNGCLFQN